MKNYEVEVGYEFFSNCENCPYPIYIGDKYYDIDGNNVHMDCLHDYITEKKVAVLKVAVVNENWIQTEIK